MFIASLIIAIGIVLIAFLKLLSKKDRLEQEDLEFMNAYKNYLKSEKEKINNTIVNVYEIIKK